MFALNVGRVRSAARSDEARGGGGGAAGCRVRRARERWTLSTRSSCWSARCSAFASPPASRMRASSACEPGSWRAATVARASAMIAAYSRERSSIPSVSRKRRQLDGVEVVRQLLEHALPWFDHREESPKRSLSEPRERRAVGEYRVDRAAVAAERGEGRPAAPRGEDALRHLGRLVDQRAR